MNQKQEAKFEALWSQDITYGENDKPVARCYYEAGLRDANGIVEEPMRSMQSESYPKDNSAPKWVIDMIRTGRPVRCKVWDDDQNDSREGVVYGYRLEINSNAYTFGTAFAYYMHAEPIHAWKPQNNELVLFDDDGRAMSGFIRNGILYARGLICADWEKRERVKPFDASAIGKPWDDIS